MTTAHDPTTIARHYVGASNAHDLETIRSMLAPDIVYSSSGVGAHSGIEAVMTMMSGFFRRFPDVNWTCSAFAAHERDGAEFHYVLRATESATGQVLRRAGIERVWIDPQGDLRRIEVRDGSGTDGATCG